MKGLYPHRFIAVLLVVTFTLSMISCANEAVPPPPVEEVQDPATPADNSQNSLDWNGTYKGTTPCADCEGIEVELRLSQDSTYTLSQKYLGKGDGTPIVKTGNFTWSTDGSTVELGGITDAPAKFKVGEGRIWMLDMQGNKIEGELADKYILTKQ
jgi:uncharacterized lipoprotein NlpE involved in copper resistance